MSHDGVIETETSVIEYFLTVGIFLKLPTVSKRDVSLVVKRFLMANLNPTAPDLRKIAKKVALE